MKNDPLKNNSPTLLHALDYLNQVNYCINQYESYPSNTSLDETYRQILTMWKKTYGILIQESNVDDQHKSALFALAAYTDEAVFSIPSENSLAWSKHSLQRKHFHSQQAGVEFFEKLKQAIDNDDVETATIYVFCLQLGFKGKYKINKQTSHQSHIDLPASKYLATNINHSPHLNNLIFDQESETEKIIKQTLPQLDHLTTNKSTHAAPQSELKQAFPTGTLIIIITTFLFCIVKFNENNSNAKTVLNGFKHHLTSLKSNDQSHANQQE